MLKVIVTGAAGFIGFHVAERLLRDGAAVLGLDNLNAYYDPALKRARLARLEARSGFEFALCHLVDDERVAGLFESFRPTHVVHLAAQAGVRHSIEKPKDYLKANIDGFLSVLEACRRAPVRHLLYASSSSVYGANETVPFSEHDGADHPVSLYAATKRANELMAHAYAHLFAIPATGLRFFTVYGPWGRPDMAYYGFTRAILEGRPIELFNGGRMSRDFTYIDDAVDAIAALLDAPPPDPERSRRHPASSPALSATAPFALFNVGNHTPVSLEDFVAAIERATGIGAERIYRPMQPGDVPSTYADLDDLTARTGLAPGTSIEEGIARFVAWFRDYHGVAAPRG